MNLVSSIISLLVVCKGGLTLGYDSNKLGVQNIPLRTLLSALRLDPQLEVWFLEFGGSFFVGWDQQDSRRSSATRVHVHFSQDLKNACSKVNSSSSTSCFQLIELLGFGYNSLVMDRKQSRHPPPPDNLEPTRI